MKNLLLKALLFFGFIPLFFSSVIHAMNIAITIDDYPLPNSGIYTICERTQLFIDALAPYNAKAAFFCVGQHCLDRNDDSLFTMLHEAGHFLGNHSMNHRGLSSISIEEFEQEILLADAVLNTYKAHKWFRYPYLDYAHKMLLGGSKEKLLQSMQCLHALGYKEGYVTINTYDWYINKRLQEALHENKEIDYAALKDLYISLLEEWIIYYGDLYKQIINQEIVHTILLHDNDLNALFLPDILAMIKKNGWNIVSPELAFKDSSWRRQLISKIDCIKKKPASLNKAELDKKFAAVIR